MGRKKNSILNPFGHLVDLIFSAGQTCHDPLLIESSRSAINKDSSKNIADPIEAEQTTTESDEPPVDHDVVFNDNIQASPHTRPLATHVQDLASPVAQVALVSQPEPIAHRLRANRARGYDINGHAMNKARVEQSKVNGRTRFKVI